MKNFLFRVFSKKEAVPEPAEVIKKQMKITQMAVATLRAQIEATKVRADEDKVKPPEIAPGVIPGGQKAKLAMDHALTDVYAYANTCYFGRGFMGYPALAELATRPEYRRMSEIIASEMTRKWIKIKAAGGGTDKADRVKEVAKRFLELKIQSLFKGAIEQDGFYGRGQIYIDLRMPRGGLPVYDTPDELKAPLVINKNKIPKGSLIGFRLVEPMWTYPNKYNADNPLHPEYFKPTTWFVMGKEVHTTRLLKFVFREVPDMLKPAYNFGGLSLSQMTRPYVENWTRTRESVSDLVHSFSITGIKTDLSSALEGGGTETMMMRAELFNLMRDNRGLMMTQKGEGGEGEEFFQLNTPLGGLDKLQAQAQEHMPSVCGIPLVKFTGITPAGLNASSDGEIRVFYDSVHALQEFGTTDNLKTVMDVVQLDLWGEIDDDITFEYVPLYQMSDEQLATIRKTDAETFAIYLEGGVVSNEEERQRIADDPNGVYGHIDATTAPERPESDDGEGVEELDDPVRVPADADA